MGKHEWFTLAEAAEIWGAKDGIADMVRLILEGDVTLTASYILLTPWKASYIKRIEEPSADKEKWYSPELKEVWSVYIEVRGLIDLDFSGECRNADGSITIRGDGTIKDGEARYLHWGKVYITLPDSSTSLTLISTGETPEELQECLNIEPEHDLIVTRDHLKDFARMRGRSSVLVKLESLPASGNVAATEVSFECKRRVDIGNKQQQEHVVFDATITTKKYRVPEGHEPVRLASASGHVLLVGEEPRHILVGFEREALEKGCIAVGNNESSDIIADFFPNLASMEPGQLLPPSATETNQEIETLPGGEQQKDKLEAAKQLITLLKKRGMTDKEIAREIDDKYPGQISDAKLGLLFPNAEHESYSAKRKRGQRLRGKVK